MASWSCMVVQIHVQGWPKSYRRQSSNILSHQHKKNTSITATDMLLYAIPISHLVLFTIFFIHPPPGLYFGFKNCSIASLFLY